MINKKVANAEDAISDIKDGDTIMLGGFGLCGIPEKCIAALVRKGIKNLTIKEGKKKFAQEYYYNKLPFLKIFP